MLSELYGESLNTFSLRSEISEGFFFFPHIILKCTDGKSKNKATSVTEDITAYFKNLRISTEQFLESIN